MKTSKVAVIDIERENRLSKVISLYRKGLNQEEISQELYIDQSTVCRDLQFIISKCKPSSCKCKPSSCEYKYFLAPHTPQQSNLTNRHTSLARDIDSL